MNSALYEQHGACWSRGDFDIDPITVAAEAGMSQTVRFIMRIPACADQVRRAVISRHCGPSGILRWRDVLAWAGRQLDAAPSAFRIVGAAALGFAGLFAANLTYHVLCKPTEMLALVNGGLNKKPAETWRTYGPLFRGYSTAAIPPELLAALAQVEGAGNPLARPSWRWRLSWNPFAVYQPPSTAVGMFQMTDAAFAEARRFCLRNHVVVEDACWFSPLFSRVTPNRAIELTAVYLDRNVRAILAGSRNLKPNPANKHELAAVIHLCGPGAAKPYARRGFRPPAGERCGDHEIVAYLARVRAMEQEFRRLAENS